VFYTLDGNEEWRCPSVGLEDVLRWNAESYTGRVVDGKLLTVDAPASVVAVVKETTPPIKGVLNGLKDAVLENGMTVKVGMVVNIGDKVRVDTETLEYKERVND
jgi:elongation factor P